jgi:hypothetical protein
MGTALLQARSVTAHCAVERGGTEQNTGRNLAVPIGLQE